MTEEEGRERERERRRRRWGKVRRGKHLGRGRTRREEEPQAELARPLSLSLHPSSQIPGPLRVASLVSSWLLSAFLCAPALVSFRAFLLERRPKKKKKQKSVSYQQSGKPWTGHTVKTGIVQLVWFHYSGRNVANEQTNNHQEKTFPLLIFFPPDWTTYWLEILSLSLDLATQTGHSGKWSRIVSLLHRRDLGANRNEKFGRKKGNTVSLFGVFVHLSGVLYASQSYGRVIERSQNGTRVTYSLISPPQKTIFCFFLSLLIEASSAIQNWGPFSPLL